MPATTGQLGLVTPTQGDLSGTWGNTVNNGITEYTNIAIAGTLTLSGDGAVTLANTTGDASATNITASSTLAGAGTATAQFAIIKVTGALTTAKIITAPSYSKTYLVVNAATGSTVSFIRSGQTPAISIAVGESAFVYYNGTDYVKLATTTSGTGSVTSVAATVPSVFSIAGSPITTSGTLAMTYSGTALPTTSGGTGLTSFTSGGVVYASSTSALATGSVLSFDGTNLGIGTSSPSSKIEAVAGTGAQAIAVFRTGDATAANNAGGGFNATSSATAGSRNARMWLDADGANFSGGDYFFIDKTGNNGIVELIQASNAAMTFQTNSTERARFDSSGNLGIGTTAPANKLTVAVVGNATLNTPAAHIAIFNSNDAVNNQYYGLAFTNSNTPEGGVQKPQALISCISGGGSWSSNWAGDLVFSTASGGATAAPTEKVRIFAAGGLSVGTTTGPGAGAIYATGNITAYYSSDIKFKENVRDIPDALATVNAIGGKLFDWKDDYIESKGGADGYFVQKADFGVVAQDVQKVFPIAVRTREDGSLAVDYEKLGALAFAAVGELTALVQTLATRVEALEAK